MEEKQILSNAAAAITNRPVTITIDILYPKEIEIPKYSFYDRLLFRLKLKQKPELQQPETERVFEIKQAPITTLVRISEELLEMDIDILMGENTLENNYKLISEQGKRMAKISAIAVSPPDEEPPDELVDFFMSNLTSQELLRIVTIVFKQMDIFSFMNTIISIRGINILGIKNASVTNANKNEVSL